MNPRTRDRRTASTGVMHLGRVGSHYPIPAFPSKIHRKWPYKNLGKLYFLWPMSLIHWADRRSQPVG